jgi:purine-binding chemotaxis protein CheW
MRKKLSFRKMLDITKKDTLSPKGGKPSKKKKEPLPAEARAPEKPQKPKREPQKKREQKKQLAPPRQKVAEKQQKEPLEQEPKARRVKTQKKVVLFRLSNEFYGIDVSKIDEIIDAHINEKIAGMPKFVAGVISLRGESIPVLSLNERFHLSGSTREETNTVLVTSKNGEPYGICIDELRGVIDINASQILAVPSIFAEDEMAYFEGIIAYGKEIAALIDIERVLNNYRLG